MTQFHQDRVRDSRPDPDDAARPMRYLWALAGSALATMAAGLLFRFFDRSNIVMLFMLAVVLTAIRFGRGPAALAAVVNVIVFDFFFVEPRFSFAVSDVQYLFTFGVMLAVGLVIGQMTAALRYQASVASHRESRTRSLYELARELSGALTVEQITEICARNIQQGFRSNAALLLPDASDRLRAADASDAKRLGVLDTAIAQWAFDHARPAGFGTDTLPASSTLYLPLKGPMRTRGVLAIKPAVSRWFMVPEQRRQLDISASLIAIALERVHYVDVAQEAVVEMESERLRNSLLSALSHDLRTPLTALVGLADTLAQSEPALEKTQAELAAAMRDETMRMSSLVHNLLDMARFEAGELRLRLEWQLIEEVVGSALASVRSVLMQHRVSTTVPAGLPLVRFDATLIERVLCNLLENASKYAPPASNIRVDVALAGPDLRVTVADNGPGFPSGADSRIFEKFTRGSVESAIPGVGLGLALCRTIVEAHGGKIWAERNLEGGASFLFTLPLGSPPQIDSETA